MASHYIMYYPKVTPELSKVTTELPKVTKELPKVTPGQGSSQDFFPDSDTFENPLFQK